MTVKRLEKGVPIVPPRYHPPVEGPNFAIVVGTVNFISVVVDEPSVTKALEMWGTWLQM